MRKIIILTILLFLSVLIGVWYNVIYKQNFLDNDENNFLQSTKIERKGLLNTWNFEDFKDFYTQVSMAEYSGFSDDTWDNEIEKSFNFYQDINFEGIVKNPSLKAVMNTIDKQPHNINWNYFWIVYGIGSEDVRNFYLTDVIKLVSYNENTKELVTVSIPRDLMIKYKWQDMKIDFLYDHIYKQVNNKKKAVEMLTNFISNQFQLPISYYVLINFDNFKELIDSIGWINFCAEKPIYRYDEETWKKELVMNKGCDLIDGSTALKVSRTRKQDNDFYRTLRQTQVIKSIYEKIVSLDYSHLYKVALSMLGKIETNLNVGEIIYSAGNFDIKRNVNIVINADCNLQWGQIRNLKFCLLKNGGKKAAYELTSLVEREIMNHYIHSIILYPQLFNCEFEWKGPVEYMLNLKNLWLKIKKFRFSKDFEIKNLNWCSEAAVNYFLSQDFDKKDDK